MLRTFPNLDKAKANVEEFAREILAKLAEEGGGRERENNEQTCCWRLSHDRARESFREPVGAAGLTTKRREKRNRSSKKQSRALRRRTLSEPSGTENAKGAATETPVSIRQAGTGNSHQGDGRNG